MKLWIRKNSEVSVVEQIVTQIKVGIAGGDLVQGQKLPSTREVARRFGVHANTVAAAYRRLAAEEVLEARKGSGMFVAAAARSAENGLNLDVMMAEFVAYAASAGFSRRQIEDAVDRWRTKGSSRRLIIIESDPGLRSIISAEVQRATGLTAEMVDIDEFHALADDRSSVAAALYDERETIGSLIAPGSKVVFLEVNSVANSLGSAGRPNVDGPIAVVSCWDQFLTLARVYLLAARIDPEMLMIRSTADEGWERGLTGASVVICDTWTATRLSGLETLRVFTLIRPDSIEQLKHALV